MEKKNNSILKRQIDSAYIIKIIYLIFSFIFTIPSIIYLINNKTVYYFTKVYTYTFKGATTVLDNYINAIIYLILFFTLFFCYFYILKNSKKIFKNTKSLFCFIIIIGILFSIIIPTTSLDVYSYIGNGWVDSNYSENPYYTPVEQVTNKHGFDEMLGKVARCWRNETVVYGPVWSLICKILTSFSFGKITNALYIFKIATLIIFVASSVLIYKITKKKFFVILFALNPFILFEFLTNVHNDIFLVFFVLLAIYFIKNKKNIALAVASLAIATGIKYLSILLLPFILAYALRNENTKNKIKKIIIYGIEFIAILFAFYLIYVRDLQVLSGLFIQQSKYGRSIFFIIYNLLNGDEKALSLVKIISLVIFALAYIAIVLKLLFNKNTKKLTFSKTMKTYQIFLLIFTFVLITNFNPWYVIWLFPTIMWQKAKNIRYTLYLSFGVINSYVITYATKIDNETVGIPYVLITILTMAILEVIRQINRKIKTNNKIKKRRIK